MTNSLQDDYNPLPLDASIRQVAARWFKLCYWAANRRNEIAAGPLEHDGDMDTFVAQSRLLLVGSHRERWGLDKIQHELMSSPSALKGEGNFRYAHSIAGRLANRLLSIGHLSEEGRLPPAIENQAGNLWQHIEQAGITRDQMLEALGPMDGPNVLGMYTALALRANDEDGVREVVGAALERCTTDAAQSISRSDDSILTSESSIEVRVVGAIAAAAVQDAAEEVLLAWPDREPSLRSRCGGVLTNHQDRLFAEPDLALSGDRDVDVFAAAADLELLPQVIDAATHLDDEPEIKVVPDAVVRRRAARSAEHYATVEDAGDQRDPLTWTDAAHNAHDQRVAKALGLAPEEGQVTQAHIEKTRPAPGVELSAAHEEITGTDETDTALNGGLDAIG